MDCKCYEQHFQKKFQQEFIFMFFLVSNKYHQTIKSFQKLAPTLSVEEQLMIYGVITQSLIFMKCQ